MAWLVLSRFCEPFFAFQNGFCHEQEQQVQIRGQTIELANGKTLPLFPDSIYEAASFKPGFVDFFCFVLDMQRGGLGGAYLGGSNAPIISNLLL